MPNFLDLPREIRDLIYGFALTSPTSRYLVTLQKNRALPKLPPTSIRLQPCNVFIRRSVRAPSPPNMALQRACRQVHAETIEWIWEHNIIVFANASDTLVILKRMGQQLSRKIRKVVLHIDQGWNQDKSTLVKALSMLASRTRKGELHEVGLVLDIRKEKVMPNSPLAHSIMGGEAETKRAKNTVYWLKKGAAAGWHHAKVKRTLDVRYDPRSFNFNDYTDADDYYDILDTILADCHHAWGGQVICAGKVVYETGLKVAEIPRAPPSAGKKLYREKNIDFSFLEEPHWQFHSTMDPPMPELTART
jgi:hypothetical protein